MIYIGIGENITAYHPYAEGVINAWMESPGHRDNIVAPHYTQTGIAVYKGEEYHSVYVQIFTSK